MTPFDYHNLKDLKTRNLLSKEIDKLIAQDHLGNLLEFYQKFNKVFNEFKEKNPQEKKLISEYKSLLVKLRFHILPALTENELESLFTKNTLSALKQKINLEDKLSVLFKLRYDKILDNKLRRLVLKALRENKEQLGSEKIIVEKVGKEEFLEPIVQNWLKIYDIFSEGKVRTAVERATFLSQNKNAQKLNSEDQELLLEILKLYDFLRHPLASESLTIKPTGHEEPKKIEMISTSSIQEISKKVPSPSPPPPPVKKPSPTDTQASKAVHIFHPEDEEELKEFKKKVDSLPAFKPHEMVDFHKITQKIIQKFNLKLNDILQRRLENIIETRFRDIRDSLETEEILARSQNIGGMGFDSSLAHEIVREIEKNLKEIPKALEKKLEEKEKVLRPPSPPSPPPPSPPPPSPPTPPKTSSKEAEKTPFIPQIKRRIPSLKPSLADIKAPPKVLGPIDELKEISLKDFHRLATTPQEACAKIKEKIEALELESIDQKAKGIQAFRSSPLMKLYISIGRQAMEEKRSVAEIIRERIDQGKPTITLEEFQCIADLNKSLRF